jgi:branched-chain amino acid transport system substrate-binding protein
MNSVKTNKIIVTTTALLVASVALAGCHEPAGTDEQLRIGSILPLTGDLGPFGPSAQQAVDLAVAHVNAAGGVNGQDVIHIGRDSQSRGEAAFSAATNLLEVERVHAVVGAMGSTVSLNIIDRFIDAQIPMISPSNTAPTFTDYEHHGWYFRTVPTDAVQGMVMANMLMDEGMETVSIIALNNDYGVGFGGTTRDHFESLGGTVAAYVLYDPEGADFSADVDQAMNPGPEAVVLIGYPDTGRVILEDAFAKGHLDDIPWFFGEGMKSQSFVTEFNTEVGEGALNGVLGTSPEEMTDDGFLQDFEAATGGEPALFSDRTYDAAVLVMLGAEHCSCTGGQALLDSMRAVNNSPGEEVTYDVARALDLIRDGQDIVWTGAAGPMEWDDVNDVEVPFSLWRIDDGQIVDFETGVWP